MGAPVQPSYTQAVFRGRNDDGSQTSATWIASADTNFTQIVNTTFRLRFRVQQTVTSANTNLSKNFKLRFSDGGAYTDIGAQDTTATKVRYVDSSNITDNEATTNQLGSGTGSFIAGDVDENNDTGTITFTSGAASYTEVEFVIEIYGPLVTNADTLSFRVYETNDTVLNTYTVTPTITVRKNISAAVNISSTGTASFKNTYTGLGKANLTVAGSIVAASTYIPATIGFRITESGDFRITEASDSRITEKYLDGQTALTASGTMTAAGDITMGGVVHFGAHDGTSAASLTATGSRTQLGSSNLSSSGTLVVTGVRIQPGVVSLSSTSTIEAFGDIAAILESGSTNLQASGNLTTLGTLTLAGRVSLTTTGSKIVVAVNNMQGQFTGEATSTLTSNGLKFIYVSKSFAATSSINASGSLTLNGSTQVSAQSTLSAAAINRKIGQTSLSASGSLIVVPSKKLKGTLNVTASLSSTVVGTRIPFTSIAYVKVAGVWTEVDPYAKHESVWKAPEFMYKKISGAWKRIY